MSIKKEYFLAGSALFLAFLSLATLFGSLGLLGGYGLAFAAVNTAYLGVFAYLYPLILLYGLRELSRSFSFSMRHAEVVLASALLSVVFLILQALIIGGDFRGKIGGAILEGLVPAVGLFGVWLLILMTLFLAVMILLDKGSDFAYDILAKTASLILYLLVKGVDLLRLLLAKLLPPLLALFKEALQRLVRLFLDYYEAWQERKRFKEATNLYKQSLYNADALEGLRQTTPLPTDEITTPLEIPPSSPPAESFQFPEAPPPKSPTPKETIEQTKNEDPQDEENLLIFSPRGVMRTAADDPEDYGKFVRLVKSSQHQESGRSFSTTSLGMPSAAPLESPATREIRTQESTLRTETPQNPPPSPQAYPKTLPKIEVREVPIQRFSKPSIVIEEVDSSGQPENQPQDPSPPLMTIPAMVAQTAQTSTAMPKPAPASSHPQEIASLIVTELEENVALLDTLEFGNTTKPKDFKLPSLGFLQKAQGGKVEIDEEEIDRKIQDLLSKLRMFKIDGDIARTYSGPIVTTFEFRPSPNVKVSRILTLEDDLAMALRAKTIRIQAPVPGKDVVGIEIPNQTIETIYLREVLESELFQKSTSPLTLALGKDIVGKPFVTDLKKLPHLLIAGTTGSGKSVGINAMILSLLYKNSPDNLRLLMIDPKMLEFSIYNDIPHLLAPVITQPKKAIAALASTVGEMERRYEAMSRAKTKNIENYNEKAIKEGFKPLPYIVVIIDELADLMMTGGKEVEYSIARLAQMARASGIHLIVATQRPSVDIVTGLIKANLPSRISYKVGQKIDSKVILDSFGAESLLGRGDMLFTPPGSSGLVRLHAPWSTESEIEEIVEYLKAQREVEYDENFVLSDEGVALGMAKRGGEDGEGDDLYEQAKQIIISDRKTSISYIQRRLGIGYNKAATLIEQMEKNGFLSAPNSKGNRDILG